MRYLFYSIRIDDNLAFERFKEEHKLQAFMKPVFRPGRRRSL